MFNNAGKKIQSFIKIIFVIGIIFLVLFCLIIAAACSLSPNLVQTIGSGAAFGVGIVFAIIVFVLCLLGIWLSCLFYFAFGKIAECVEEQNELTKKLIDTVSSYKGNSTI